MVEIESIRWLNSLVFLFLGGIHVYWAMGGKWGTKYAIPSTVEGVPVFQPKKKGTLLVACALFGGAFWNIGFLDFGKWGYLLIGIAFGLRAFGDFKYVGISKKIKNTTFAQKDATVFIPLCIYLCLSHLFLFFL